MSDEPQAGFGSADYRYSLMTKDGKYQWRYVKPYPPEVKDDPSYSPVFDSKEEAIAWREKKSQGQFVKFLEGENAGWSTVP